MPIRAGALLAQRYRATSLLGRGGMGEVWRCADLEQKRDVAIKAVRAEFLSDPGIAKLFHSEIVAVARLSHRGIIPVYDLIRSPEGTTLLVMAYREGTSLSAFTGADLTWPFVLDVLRQVLEAVAFAHARGVLHLDIKPENVLIERRSTQVHATLLDFGVARVRRPGRGVERWFDRDAVIGTVEYMAPEQCSGTFERLGPWTDLFSIGAMVFELCAGRRPFPGSGDPAGTIRRLSAPPPRLVSKVQDTPPELVSLCAMLLANEPRNRPFQAADVLRILRTIAGDSTPSSPRFPTAGADEQVETQAALEPTVDESMTGESHASVNAFAGGVAVLGAPSIVEFDPDSDPGAHEAFAAEAELPASGAYGLFGLRDLPVLGRTEERVAVWSAVRATVMEKRPRVVVLEGPVGVGKSRLARDAMERAVELGYCTPMQTSWSHDGSGDEGLRGLIENLLDTRGAPAEKVRARLDFWLERVPGAHRSFIREVELFLRPPRDAEPDAGFPLRVAVDAIARAATLRPLLLWLDDVQWSRGEAGALLGALRAREPAIAVCVIATVRSEEIVDEVGYQAIVSAPGTERVRLDPLDLAATRRLVSGLLDVDDPLGEFLAARAEGNPLFVTQLIHQLVLAEAVELRDGQYRLARAFDLSTVPADIRAVWNRRLAHSGANLRDLAALALVRDRVSLEVAEELGRLLAARTDTGDTEVDVGPSSFDASLARALSCGLLRIAGGAYVWAHGLLREHLIKGLTRDVARRLHGLAGAALAPLIDREDVQEERATHLRRAGREQDACEALLEAGLWSARRADAGPRRTRFETLAAWSKAARIRGLEARALAELAYFAGESGDAARADQCIAQARALLAGDVTEPSGSWVALRHSQVARLRGQVADGARATAEALQIARATGVTEVERIARIQLGLDASRSGRFDEARPLLHEVALACRAAGDRVGEAIALRSMTHTEDTATALGMVERAIELAQAAGALRIELTCKQVWVDMLWRSGARDSARREARNLAAEAAARRLRQTVSLLQLQSAAWAASDRDWAALRTHRDAAGQWGASSGAAVERVIFHALEVLIAVVSADERAALLALVTLEGSRQSSNDATIGDIMQIAITHAPPSIAGRLRALEAPARTDAPQA